MSMEIIVHRTTKSAAMEAYEILLNMINQELTEFFHTYKVNIEKNLIYVNGMHISFFCGRDIWRMAGTRPNYYNTDSLEASHFLSQGASKVKGEEINSLEELYEIIKRR